MPSVAPSSRGDSIVPDPEGARSALSTELTDKILRRTKLNLLQLPPSIGRFSASNVTGGRRLFPHRGAPWFDLGILSFIRESGRPQQTVVGALSQGRHDVMVRPPRPEQLLADPRAGRPRPPELSDVYPVLYRNDERVPYGESFTNIWAR